MANVTDDNVIEVPKETKEIGKQILEYKTLDVYIRKQGSLVFIEAFGPGGEWAETHTEMPDEEDMRTMTDSYKMAAVSGNSEKSVLDKLGDRLGNILMPGPILQLYSAVLQRTFAHPNKGLGLKLHFLSSSREYAWLPWEAIRINGRTIAMDPRQTIVR
ncbi:MAG TPA: hypothetical protein VIO11_06010, partial [Candidatus Methanoperedens sp.]